MITCITMPRHWGYVQDERYTAGAGSAGAVRVSFAQRIKNLREDAPPTLVLVHPDPGLQTDFG